MAMEKTYIGIDPGKTGASAFLSGNDFKVFDFDDSAGILFLNRFNMDLIDEFPVMVVLEKVNAMPKQGVTSTFNFGDNFGQWKGRLDMARVPYTLATPRTWQKVVFDSGSKKGDRKTQSLELARRLFPSMAGYLSRKKDHNRADALLIAEYCRRMDYRQVGV